MSAHVRLRHFLTDTSRSVSCVARELGVTRTMVGHLLAGRRVPGLGLASRIELLSGAWTHGPLRAVEWATAPARKPAAAKARRRAAA